MLQKRVNKTGSCDSILLMYILVCICIQILLFESTYGYPRGRRDRDCMVIGLKLPMNQCLSPLTLRVRTMLR
jgi:hypothetical protein